MKKFLLLVSLVLALDGIAQVELKLIFKGLVLDSNRNAVSGAGIYLIQDNATVGKANSDRVGSYVLSGSVYKKTKVVVQCSKPGYLTRNLSFDISDLTIPRKVLSLTLMLGENLTVQMIPVNPMLSFTVGANDVAEKYKWDDQQLECIPDLGFKQKYNDSLKQRVQTEEARLLLEKFKSKSRELEQVKNFQLALNYLDSAITTQSLFKLSDTTLATKKQRLNKSLSEQIIAQNKQKKMDSLFFIGDTLMAVFKWQEAEKVYQQISTIDAKSEKLKTKLAAVAKLKLEEENRKKDLDQWKKNREECTKLAAAKKYNEAKTALNKSNTLSLIPQVLKNSIPLTIDSLDLLIKEQNLDVEVKNTMDAAKKIKGDNNAMQKALEKITSLIGNYKEPQKQATSFADLDKIITDYVDAEIKSAYELQTNQDYDKAIKVYDETRQIIAFMHDIATKKTKLSDIGQKVEAAKNAKQADIQAFSSAILKVRNGMDSTTFDRKYGTKFQPTSSINTIKTLLASDPLKKKSTNTEVVSLTARFNKLISYFEDNKNSLVILSDKDSSKALKAATDLMAKAKAAEVGKLEISFLQLKIDSLETIIKSSKPTVSNPNSFGGRVLTVPTGAILLPLGTPNNPPMTLEYEARRAMLVRKAWDKLKLSIENRQIQEGQLHHEAMELQRTYLKNQNILMAVSAEKEGENSKQRELQGRNLVNETTSTLVQQKLDNLALTERLADQQDARRNRNDSISAHHEDQHTLAREGMRSFIDSVNVKTTQQNLKETELNRRLDSVQRAKVNTTENLKNKNDNEALEQSKRTQRAQENRLNFKENTTMPPNYLKDDKGVCFPWNTMTELVYIFEDPFGFEVGKLVRRVVVNAQGYGVVYEQTINEHGNSSYTLDGQLITEANWLHDSKGTPFFEPGGPITPLKCP